MQVCTFMYTYTYMVEVSSVLPREIHRDRVADRTTEEQNIELHTHMMNYCTKWGVLLLKPEETTTARITSRGGAALLLWQFVIAKACREQSLMSVSVSVCL